MEGIFGFIIVVLIAYGSGKLLRGVIPQHNLYTPPSVDMRAKYSYVIQMLCFGLDNVRVTTNTGNKITIKGGDRFTGYRSITLHHPDNHFRWCQITIQDRGTFNNFSHTWGFDSEKRQTEILARITEDISNFAKTNKTNIL